MTTNDPVSDLLTRIRNGISAQHRFTDVFGSKLVVAVLNILKQEGFIENFLQKDDGQKSSVRVYLKYSEGRQPVIHGIKKISKPGLRRYVTRYNIPRVCGGLGISVLTTSRGVMSGDSAKKQRIGGELLCYVW